MRPPLPLRDPLLVARSIPDEIVSVLQAEIISGRYSPGQRLVERELSSRFSVSSIPIREALLVLERRGLAVRRQNRGCSVIELSAAELDQICELRELLEPTVVEWAACRVTASGAERLKAQLEKLGLAAAAKSFPRFFQEDLQFHQIMWELSENQFAMKALEPVCGSLFACGLRRAEGIDLAAVFAQHERLAEALIGGRSGVAAQLARDVVVGFRRHLSRHYDRA